MTAYRAVRRGADLRYGESEAVVATGAGSNILHLARGVGGEPPHF
ncbi:MAG TPA: alcohol dehydrogenase, partial [Cutibacterium acnes]|nr:alcohol dehydrogenase [Cutibacterium acnes]